MTISIDALGQWHNLGSVLAVKRQWSPLPTLATSGNATLRASFLCSDWAKLTSYLLIRPRYDAGAVYPIGNAIKIYPSQNPIIISAPIPEELKQRGVTSRGFEVYKVGRYYRYIGITPDANLEVRLEELWDSPI